MFSKKVIAANIDRLERSQGIKLTEYPVEKAVAVYAHFLSFTRTDGKRTWYQRDDQTEEQFEFVQWERDWIRNELFLCSCSFPYWFFRYFFIKTKDAQIRRPDLLIAQRIFLDILADLDEQNLPIILFVLKARQLGISTITEAIILWIALFRRGSHTLISSAEEQKSIDMSEMVWIGLNNLPLWMAPVLTGESKARGPIFGELSSDILIQHGAMQKGIGRGSTPIAAHVSEVAYYNNPVVTIESSLLKAMHENPRTFLVLESTAKRKYDWFHNTWTYNRDAESKGMNKYTCLFLPWYVGSDKYPTSDWIRNHPIPDNWKPSQACLEQALKAELYVATTPLLLKYLGAKWKMPREQMWFWEFEYAAAMRDEDSLRSFYAEMAADEVSAFQSKRSPVYSIATQERLRSQISNDYTDYAVLGDGIDKRFHLSDYHSTGRRIVIEWMTMLGEPRRWELVPLKETPSDPFHDLFLRIWEHPKRGFNYSIPADTGGGIGSDHSCIEVLRVGRKGEPDVQVAQLYSSWLPAIEMPPFMHAVGAYYGRMMEPLPEAYLCPETQLGAGGDPIVHQLTKEGYSNIHRMRRYDMAPKSGSLPNRLGWATTSWSRPLITQTLQMAIEYGWIRINSDRTVEEIENLEMDEGNDGKLRQDHSSHSHDDSYMSLCIGHWCSHDEETLAERKAGKRPKPKDSEIEKPSRVLQTAEEIMANSIRMEERMIHEPTDEEMEFVY
jgi:hypothetical protein